MDKKAEKIINDIKKIKIQGARNIALSAIKLYAEFHTKEVKEKLISARPTEPLLFNSLQFMEENGIKKTLSHFSYSQAKMNYYIYDIIKNNSIVFTHCHSSSVINALIYCHKRGKKFEVYNTETRPLFQGRKTSEEIKKAGIKVTEFIDSAASIALLKAKKKSNVIVLFGADAVLKHGVINKVGSGMFAQVAYDNKIPVYIAADSWKFSHKDIPIESRSKDEVWNNSNVNIENPAFELIPQKYITGLISELGVKKFQNFIKIIS